MVHIEHNWDEEDYEKTLEQAWQEYRYACYGNAVLPPEQVRETKQAFFSGIHWLNCRDNYAPSDLEQGLRKQLSENNPYIKTHS